MNGVIIIPLLAFSALTIVLVLVSLDQFVEKGLSFSHLAAFLLKAGGSCLFLLPVAALLLDPEWQWYVVEFITLLFVFSAILALIGEFLGLFSSRKSRSETFKTSLHTHRDELRLRHGDDVGERRFYD